MTRYFLRQTFWSIIKLFVFITFMFFFIQVAMPGDFIDQFSLACDAACRQAMREQLGLDLPLWERYVRWLGQIVTLDFGNSMYGPPVIDLFKQVIPPTLLVFVTGTIISFLIGAWLGKVTAWSERGLPSQLVTLGGLTFFTSFPPWLAWLVTYAVGRGASFVVMGEIPGLRSVTFTGLERELWQSVDIQPHVVTMQMMASLFAALLGVWLLKLLFERMTKTKMPWLIYIALVLTWTYAGWDLFAISRLALDIMKLAYLPLITYILLSFGETMLIMQSTLREVKKSAYVQTARAKGLPESVVRDRHALRNAILPVLSRLVISLPYLLTGVVIIESSLGWPGMGTNMWNSLYWQNMPVVMNTLLMVGIISLFARLVLDILSAYLDPRIRHRENKIVTG